MRSGGIRCGFHLAIAVLVLLGLPAAAAGQAQTVFTRQIELADSAGATLCTVHEPRTTTPEGNLIGAPCDTVRQTNGAVDNVFWKKAGGSGTDNSGWFAVAGAGGTHPIALASDVSGILPAANGGTGVNNSTRTLTVNSNAGILDFTGAALTLTIPASLTVISAGSTETFTNKTYDVEATGNVLTVTDKHYFPAATCLNATATSLYNLPATDPAVAACDTGTNIQRATLDFADGANTLDGQFSIRLSSQFTGTLDAEFTWYSATTTGSVVWQLATICVANAETGDPAYNTASTVTDLAAGTTNQFNQATITTVTITGCAVDETMFLRAFRDPTTGADDHAGTARLVGIELTLRRSL